MGNLVLRRTYLDNCTIGKWSKDGVHLVYTVERPWLSNKKSVSCIPAGNYNLVFMKNISLIQKKKEQ